MCPLQGAKVGFSSLESGGLAVAHEVGGGCPPPGVSKGAHPTREVSQRDVPALGTNQRVLCPGDHCAERLVQEVSQRALPIFEGWEEGHFSHQKTVRGDFQPSHKVVRETAKRSVRRVVQ